MIDKDRLITTFCDIVQIDSPSGEEEEMAQDLTRRLTDLGFIISRDAHGNLLASEEGSDPLMLSAHMDTVNPGRGIKPRVIGDEVHTDGTTILGGDCKAGVAAILEALESLKEDGSQRIPVQLVFTRGEEIGLVGAWNLDFSMVQAKQAVVFDGNGPVNTVITASPTYVGFDVHVTGRSAHAGVEPEKGLSAIRIAADIIGKLPQGRMDDETTINVGLITGGSVRNAVPEEAFFSGEFRSRNTETLELMRLQVEDALARARDQYTEAKIVGDLNVQFHTYHLPQRPRDGAARHQRPRRHGPPRRAQAHRRRHRRQRLQPPRHPGSSSRHVHQPNAHHQRVRKHPRPLRHRQVLPSPPAKALGKKKFHPPPSRGMELMSVRPEPVEGRPRPTIAHGRLTRAPYPSPTS